MRRPSLATLLLFLHSAAAVSLTTSANAAPRVVNKIAVAPVATQPHAHASTVDETQQQRLKLVEHAMPIMPPHLYEETLRQAFVGRGEILRWYIARVDETRGTAIAEAVILPAESSDPQQPSTGSSATSTPRRHRYSTGPSSVDVTMW